MGLSAVAVVLLILSLAAGAGIVWYAVTHSQGHGNERCEVRKTIQKQLKNVLPPSVESAADLPPETPVTVSVGVGSSNTLDSSCCSLLRASLVGAPAARAPAASCGESVRLRTCLDLHDDVNANQGGCGSPCAFTVGAGPPVTLCDVSASCCRSLAKGDLECGQQSILKRLRDKKPVCFEQARGFPRESLEGGEATALGHKIHPLL
jgi:hypothetical protein